MVSTSATSTIEHMVALFFFPDVGASTRGTEV